MSGRGKVTLLDDDDDVHNVFGLLFESSGERSCSQTWGTVMTFTYKWFRSETKLMISHLMKMSITSYFISTKKEKLTEATNTPAQSANSDVTDHVTTTTGTSDTESIEVPELSYEKYASRLVEDRGSSSDSFVTGKISTPSTGNEFCDAGVSKPMYSSVTVVNDIAEFVGATAKLTNSQKMAKLHSLWKPPSNFEFPRQDGKSFKRHFQRRWLDEYKWLAYSKINSDLYCASKLSNYSNSLSPTTCHKNIVLAQADVTVVEKRKETIDMQLDHSRKKDTENNRERLHGVVETIRLCGLQNFPLRDHADSGHISLSIPVDNDANFRSLLRYRANEEDQALQDHIENSSHNVMYTSPRIQKEIIDCFGQLVQKKIAERVKKSCFYTVLGDETSDISQVEQFSLCVRYVDDYEEPYIVKDDFLSFVPVYDVTGEALAEVIERSIAACGFNLAHIRGQGYDGASSMRGQFREDLKDTYEDAFKGEWDLWKKKWNGIEEKPTCAIDGLAKCDRHLFPNEYILLKILAVLPVSPISVERSFLNMKLIKSFLRSTISENRLNGLALMFIHRALTLQISIHELLDHFTQPSQRILKPWLSGSVVVGLADGMPGSWLRRVWE
ncbi:hypothetical protein PR048_021276 [Dryococelus australis]|uniref:Uncharacterized protein n=1 Tax=Dryococelus australis TaxID=614101 RepID=A0ABQ9GXR5_9NEOP|nr:hypothetical protein PR048_021276 [Dryococelus australis]